MNVLIINLTRFGDLLQTQPVILGLKEQGHRVGLLCLENFAPAAALLRGVDYVASLPGGKLLSHMDTDWRLALHMAHEGLERIAREFPVQAVVNTTATLSARLLARLLSTQCRAPILGFGMDAEGFGISGDMWATFLQGTSMERLNCPFNLVDMFRMAAQVGRKTPLSGLCPPAQDVREAAARRLEAARPEGCTGYVAFQLGASEARRQWPVVHFAALGARLWQTLGLCPVLVGSAGERALAEAYAAAFAPASVLTPASLPATPCIDCIGSTDIPQLAGLLQHTRLLVSNDTGTLHLAAGLGVPVLGIFLATAQPWDTGPYLPQCCCLEPALPCHPCPFHQPCSLSRGGQAQPCLQRISADTVFALVSGYVREGQWPALVQDEARVWLTCTDAAGFADLRCLSGHEREERSRWLRLQRHFYRHILDKLDGNTPPEPEPDMAEHAQGLSEDFRAAVSTTLRQSEDLLLLLCQQATLLRRMPNAQLTQRVLGTCARVHTVLDQCAPLRALAYLWQVLSQERGGDMESFVHMAQVLRQGLSAWREVLTQE